jgi:hypothetical protein
MAKTMEMTHQAGANITDTDHRFFDPKAPEQPEQILGVDTEAILRLGEATTALGVLPSRVNLGLYALPNAVRLVPLIEEMQSGTELAPEDVRPYRKPIKGLNMDGSFADKLAAGAGVIGVGVPIRRAINRKIEREFPSRATEVIDKARETIAGIENDVDYVASFENPKEQFVAELDDLAQTVSTAIYEQRDMRVRGNVQAETKPELPKGVMGFLAKAVRKVRSFFGFFRRKPEVNKEITAYDAGAGIEKTIRSLTNNQGAAESRLPMLSKFLLSRLPNNMPIARDRLALAAPELLNFLFSTSSEDSRNRSLIDSVNRNPHEFRFVTKIKKHYGPYGRYSLYGIQHASMTLLPAIKDILPTEGAKVREIFDQAQALLRQKPSNSEVSEAEQAASAKTTRNRIRNRLKHLLRRKSRD